MALNQYFFHYEEFMLHYNCSAYEVNSIPLEQRRHLDRGLILFLLGLVLEACYIPCVYVMLRTQQLRRQPCYQLMIQLGFIDITACFSFCAVKNDWFKC